ncbi:unnamed protein product [Paramecium octaurelia]|uniref:PHD-type domain-containing protein n=1 Tax=Paramecium octaurelia TaxID=43137 RepID=A0A8S1TC04_PAROT|nr:unnamed protein product [Paramecium octaurelia]
MDLQYQEQLNIKRTLGYWIPGASLETMKQKLNQKSTISPFKKEEFLIEIKAGKFNLSQQDDKYLSETEKAYLIAYNPEKRVRSDYECMFMSNDEKTSDREEQTNQKCENPNCPGTDTKWIECSEKKCWYHQSCAGIPLNKTQEEIDQMDWKCRKCRKR